MRILFIGDIVGEPGRSAVRSVLASLKSRYDLVVANGENAAGGKGISWPAFDDLLTAGVHVVTLGNHTFARREVADIINHPQLVRPLNYPEGNPGSGSCVVRTRSDVPVAIVNLQGRTFMHECLDCPFRAANAVIDSLRAQAKVILVDMHAEATSEKLALARFLDGKVSAVVGTHTHVQTNDARILAGGTGFISDAGMCGPQDSVIGMQEEGILKRYLLCTPQRFTVAEGAAQFNAVDIAVDESTGRCLSIEPVTQRDIR